MSLNKIITKQEKIQKIKNKNYLNIIKSHISVDEIDSNPLIKDIVKRIKKIKLNHLTNSKPHLTPIKDIKNEKEIKLVDNIDSFRKIYYEYNLNQKVPKNNEQKVYTGQKNYNFSKLYNIVKERNNLEQKEMLEEIEGIYKKSDFSLPNIDKNLFNRNLLLLNENNIKNSIEYNLTTDKSNKNSLSFLKKIHKSINDQIVGKSNIFSKQKDSDIKNNYYITNNIYKKDKEKVPESRKYINSIKETINDIDDLDYFFDSNNKEYFNYLKNPDSIKNSKISTRVNSSHLDFPCQNNNNIDIYKLKLKDKIKNNKSCSDINNNNSIKSINDINIYNVNSFKKKFIIEKKLFNNNSTNNINNINDKNDKTNNLIRIKKLYLNGEIKVPLKKKFLDLKIQTNEKILPLPNNKRISIDIKNNKRTSFDNLSFEKLIKLLPKSNMRASMPFSKRQKSILRKSKSELELLYDKVKKKKDSLDADNLIKKYLKNKNYNIEPKISHIDVCNYYQNIRDHILGNDYFRKYIRLKKKSGYEESNYEGVKKDYDNSLNKLNNIDDDVNKVISNL